MTKILGLASELLVEGRALQYFSTAFNQLKTQQQELSRLLAAIQTRDGYADLPMELRNDLAQMRQIIVNSKNRLSEHIVSLDDYDCRQQNLSTKLYNEVVASRLRPFSDCVQGLERMVRDTGRSLGKTVRLDMHGLDVAVDRDVLDKLKAPLTHLLRNSVDHGIEAPQLRKNCGKPVHGTIKISAMHRSGMLLIEVSDDGAGIDLEKLKQKVVRKGLASRSMVSDLSEQELMEFLFLPEFTTRDSVSELSGRGVGLDVVRSLAKELRGAVVTRNQLGVGFKVQMHLPLSLSIITALLVQVSGECYAFPLHRVSHLVSIESSSVVHVEGRQCINIGDKLVGLITASQVLDLEPQELLTEEIPVVLIGEGRNQFGLVVERFLGQRQLSVQGLDPRLGKLKDISAAALSEEGHPVLIFDVDDMLRTIEHLSHQKFISAVDYSSAAVRANSVKRVLVIDDSLTVREIERNLLEVQGYQVDIALDGMDGWDAVKREKYDLVITDIDMPRMDGIELVRAVKGDHKLLHIPVIVVSYKDRAEDRLRGLEAGADYYLTKGSFHDQTFLDAVADLIGIPGHCEYDISSLSQ